MKRLWVLVFLCSWWATPALAQPQSFSAADQSFSLQLPASFVDKTGGGKSLLVVVDKNDATLLVVTRSRPTTATPAKLLLEIKDKTPYKFLSSSLGKVGNQPAAIFLCEEVLKKQLPDSYKDYRTVMAVVPRPTALYTFQIHIRRHQFARLKSLYPGWLDQLHWL